MPLKFTEISQPPLTEKQKDEQFALATGEARLAMIWLELKEIKKLLTLSL